MYGKRVFKEVSNFNPRSREGSDKILSFYRLAFDDFNPRSREGSDINANAGIVYKYGFQSTLPRRERQRQKTLTHVCNYFNPRSREGSDDRRRYGSTGSSISIHAPAKGATIMTPSQYETWRFQSTLPRRERRKFLYGAVTQMEISIHAPAKGATRSLTS